ncbi:hypothetical protein LB543_27005 [Mesorhizobium sp. ESP7-2]|uniref:hypothetical protein n=1 Tax=Mesorhizobium sp. ESP7-2 TaxID=2876622 RepID=UPI001CCE81DF|nr:hypothetical protein [Mesorhizobium sp. ESP7-2]MBZ9710354.1 hypothetical protein [Mesorhizobium sp. ESP7-2]
MELNPNEPAILAWLPKDTTATEDDFSDDSKVAKPPRENPEHWWTLADAVDYALTVERNHDKMPWIKSGDKILGQSEISQIAVALRALRGYPRQ